MAIEMENVRYEEEFIVNGRGLKLFTCSWIPMNVEPKALVFICHGYAMECSITMNSTAMRLAKKGFGVYGIDYEGHGKSSGLQGYVSNFDNVVEDSSSFFTSITEKKENRRKKKYLMGESMGGAVALLIHTKQPQYWDGAILVAPMCKIADDMRPNPTVVSVLTMLCKIVPTWKIIPTQDIIDIAFKVPEVRQQIRENPYCYKGRPRLKTGYELLRISSQLEHMLNEVSIPFLILHGEDDRVTDKSVSRQLYDQALSDDKTLKMYPGMWHGLLYGETPENIDIVFSDIINWLEKKIDDNGNSKSEVERKYENDGFIGSQTTARKC